ncbi:MAG: SAM-dependent methyltransferase, partial [Bacteroidota bacterium]
KSTGFLLACGPAWKAVMKPGAALALAWNLRVASRKAIATALESAGLQVLDGSPFDQFAHQVDRSIRRDLIVAKN